MFPNTKLLITTYEKIPEYMVYFYGLEKLVFLVIVIVMLNSGHMDIYTTYKQCIEDPFHDYLCYIA